MNTSIFSLLVLLLCLSGCAATGKRSAIQPAATTSSAAATSSAAGDDFGASSVQKENDPFEPFNRTVFGFNDELNTHALRPLAHGYTVVVPLPVRNGITNFFDNLQFPVRFVNSVLQGKLTRSAQEAGKFVFNSTFGIGGLIRVSDHVSGLANVPAEDFGLTLADWGFPAGPYLVIPVLGPSDCRDAVGFAGDYVISPLDWHTLGFIHTAYISDAVSLGLSGARYLSGLPKALDVYDQMKSGAIDPYIAVRNAYLSYRAAQRKK
ncbi:MAG: VacJ family lipoprotein [Verrucomicrobia bacterium]|nr:VacJ family lipoprotein [Verrucomicrobiota bacterium]MBV8375444.1 VacJ family lipoprotein [Verrucomicrobiota bacterium]